MRTTWEYVWNPADYNYYHTYLLSPHDRAGRAMNYVMEISLTKWIYPDILNSRTSSGL